MRVYTRTFVFSYNIAYCGNLYNSPNQRPFCLLNTIDSLVILITTQFVSCDAESGFSYALTVVFEGLHKKANVQIN